MTKQSTLTKADLIEEVLRITELPRKESETIVETIFDSIIESLQKGQKIEIRDSAASARGSAADESAAIRRPERRWTCRPRKFPSSSPAKS